MATKSKVRGTLNPHQVKTPPLARPKPPGTSAQPPIPTGLELKAQRLIHDAGSVEAAKKLIDLVSRKESSADFLEDGFAARWGFASRRDLLEASKPLFADDSSNWWATQLGSGRWVVWSRDDFSTTDTFASLAEARRAVNAFDDDSEDGDSEKGDSE